MVFAAASHLEPVFAAVIEKAGFRLVRLRILGTAQKTLQIMAERADGSMDVEGCATLSHLLTAFIETEDPLPGDYEIEVSSPGIDRPLTRLADFRRWQGHEAKIELHVPLSVGGVGSDSVPTSDKKNPGRRRFRGRLEGVEGQDVLLAVDGARIALAFGGIAEAKLVLTDRLIRETLKAREGAAAPAGAHLDN